MFLQRVVEDVYSVTHTSLKADKYPELIKYMGSKSKIITQVVAAIDEIYKGGVICDLFAGSCSLSGALRNQAPIISNDIQEYSAVLAQTYLNSSVNSTGNKTGEELVEIAEKIVCQNLSLLRIDLDYSSINSLAKFNKIEKQSQSLINKKISYQWSLFTKFYSGTWWSTYQCAWIDALRQVAEDEKDSGTYNVILSSLMFAMAYTSQGTGHYAQYRDADNDKSMFDILMYRNKSLKNIFVKKYNQLCEYLKKAPPTQRNIVMAADYRDCLAGLEESTVYADPPYCFVHYSRFYHAIETLVLYDFPGIQKTNNVMVKGRYRENRHQSPFCIKTQVPNAFREIFKGIAKTKSRLVLSYSDSGMIPLTELMTIAEESLGSKYFLKIEKMHHKHMTMGRRDDRDRDVKEAIIIAGRK